MGRKPKEDTSKKTTESARSSTDKAEADNDSVNTEENAGTNGIEENADKHPEINGVETHQSNNMEESANPTSPGDEIVNRVEEGSPAGIEA